ncbi:hypothetical protein BD779DRAFT_1672726 [Infundibulicybe gibba]|nr:hypothetical protein BD779DRAFT_1672726 [Infundibulicybe gibba]
MARRRGESLSSSESSHPRPQYVPPPLYAHVSTYRSLQMELQIYSSSIKVMEQERRLNRGPLAVFGEQDRVSGRVILDPSCSPTGRLSISIEGAFLYPQSSEEEDDGALPHILPERGPRKHIFFSASTNIPVSPSSEGRPSFREAFVKRRPSASSLNLSPGSVERTYPFSFDLPKSCRAGEEMPSSFSTSPASGSSTSQPYQVSYQVIVSWNAFNIVENPSFLEVPILYQPDADFQSMDALEEKPDSWLEMPLRSERPIPFRCAVTVPASFKFSRKSSIPYFVVFTTTPRSAELAQEIAADATISVSLLRQITITELTTLPPTPPQTPSISSEESDTNRDSLLRRVVKNAQPRKLRNTRSTDETFEFREKPLPPLPTRNAFTESTTLQNSICIGFPKDPDSVVKPDATLR